MGANELGPFIQWVENNPNVYWCLAFFALAWLAWLSWLPLFRQKEPGRSSHLLYFISLGLALLAWRWPYLVVAHELSPDESQQIAGAITLLRDPVFWRSVDGHTAGPVNFYLLTLPSIFGTDIGYPSTRFIGIGLIAAALFLAYLTLNYVTRNPAAVRLGLFPVVLFFALATNWEFLHFSTEHVPICLLVAAVWAATVAFTAPGNKVWFWGILSGLLAGTAPWAKLQSAPAAAALLGALIFLAGFRQREQTSAKWKLPLACGIGAALPTLGFVVLAATTGQLGVLVESYVRSNAGYVQQGLPIQSTVLIYFELLEGDASFPGMFVVCLAALALGVVAWARLAHKTLLLPAAFVSLLVAAFMILAPRRAFPHYLLFAALPLGACAVASLDACIRSWPDRKFARVLLCLFFASSAVSILSARLAQPPPFSLGEMKVRTSRPQTDVAQEIASYAQPGDTLGMWGWFPQYYVETRLPQATRDAHTQRSIEPSPFRDRIRDRYLEDLQRSDPAIFVDAVGERAFAYQNRLDHAHETVPALKSWVRRKYVLAKDFGNARVYVRKDRISSPVSNTPVDSRALKAP